MPDTPEALTRHCHRATYDEKLLRATQETLERSRELLEKTKSLVSANPAGPFIGARQTDSGKCDFESEAGIRDYWTTPSWFVPVRAAEPPKHR